MSEEIKSKQNTKKKKKTCKEQMEVLLIPLGILGSLNA